MNEWVCEAETLIDLLKGNGSVKKWLIRCKDCKHYEIASDEANGWCEENECPFAPWDFCSRGERREK